MWIPISKLFFFLGKIHFTPMKFQGVFNLNPKVSKLTVYPPEVLKTCKINLLLTFSGNLDGIPHTCVSRTFLTNILPIFPSAQCALSCLFFFFSSLKTFWLPFNTHESTTTPTTTLSLPFQYPREEQSSRLWSRGPLLYWISQSRVPIMRQVHGLLFLYPTHTPTRQTVSKPTIFWWICSWSPSLWSYCVEVC